MEACAMLLRVLYAMVLPIIITTIMSCYYNTNKIKKETIEKRGNNNSKPQMLLQTSE